MFDVHTHFLAPDLPAPSEAAVKQGWPVVVKRGEEIDVYQRDRLVRVIGPSAWDAPSRLQEMDRLGVDAQVVMPTPLTFLYDADPEVAVAYAQAQNDRLVELLVAGRGRLHGLAALPLQQPDAAIAEATRVCKTLGLSGVEIGTHANDRPLHDPSLLPVFAELDRLGLCVFVHPWNPITRATHNGLAFGLGRPVETELAVGSLLAGGILERFPNLRICLAHGGGGVPALRGRLHNGWARQHESSRRPQVDPRVLLGRLWADGLTYDPDALALAEETFGSDRMLVGSDFPFSAQESPIGASYTAAASHGILEIGSRWAERTATNASAFLGRAQSDTLTAHPSGSEHNAIGRTS